jgi:sugar/nucleoside kinase (ribokinase family)
MTSPAYVLIGNITADITPNGRQLGGTVSYSALTAAAFGLSTAMVTSAAQAEPLLRQLAEAVTLQVKPAEHTTTFENIYTEVGRVQYVRGAAAALDLDDIPLDWRTAPLLHLAPIAGEMDDTMGMIAVAFPQATRLMTLQGCLRRWGDDGRVHFKRWCDVDALAHIDVVVFSEEDILESPALELEFAQLVHCLIVTRAERGGTIYLDGEPMTYAAPQVSLVHPTGAGDVFAAAFLAAYFMVGRDVRLAAQVAAHLAAISVTRVGLASVPTAEEVLGALAAIADRL